MNSKPPLYPLPGRGLEFARPLRVLLLGGAGVGYCVPEFLQRLIRLMAVLILNEQSARCSGVNVSLGIIEQ